MLDNVEYLPAPEKKCRECSQIKPLSTFGSNKSSKDGKSCYCKKCRVSREKARKEQNPEAYKEEKRKHYLKYQVGYRDRQLKRNFGIGIDQYNEMFSEQLGCCKCCGTHQENLRLGLSVDHCHATGEIRGLLCGNCNTAIGLIKEDGRTLMQMIKYLRGK